jgi:NAD(P)-dependent dehydrogenase (short-subunit alcohol dehydrogenase family)
LALFVGTDAALKPADKLVLQSGWRRWQLGSIVIRASQRRRAEMEIKGRTAVITGAGSGIGRATAMRLATEGAAVLAADVDEAAARETVRMIEAAGGRAAAVRVDVTDAEQARHMMETALSTFGRFDILHNNAGIAVGTPPFPQCDLDRWRRVLDIDLQAVIMGCYLAGPMLQRGGGGAIVNTASMAGLYPYVEDPVYAAAKAGVVNLTYSLAPWAQRLKVRVNCICPGVVDTPLVRKAVEIQQRGGHEVSLPKRILKPEQIADGVARLVRDDTIFGRALEVRPSQARLVDIPGLPHGGPPTQG